MAETAAPSFDTNGFSAPSCIFKNDNTLHLHSRTCRFREDFSKETAKAAAPGRTPFLDNAPPDASLSERDLVKFFKQSGMVEKIILDFDVKDPQGDDDMEDDDDGMDTEDGVGTPPTRRKRKWSRTNPPSHLRNLSVRSG
ncbi:hypothetical protein BKA70DRAFT_1567397 [Coprinopsis sp. MPI-PUGE-AT-0042]|nr:hypothetical protein BKA70DRAFT_1567397 [Coprinopsis sp. MPI-PUGE-AT-0042]